MRHIPLQRWLLPLFLVIGGAAGAQNADSTLVRVQRLVNAGDRTAARALADSVLLSAATGSAAYAEALFARAYASSNAADAERDYLRVTIEYPLSPRAEDALMMVAQLRLARGDRSGARRQFERMAREHPTGTQVAKSSFWAGRLALEDGDSARGCMSLAVAKEHADPADVELVNQIDYYGAGCARLPSGVAPLDSAVPDTGAKVAIRQPTVSPPTPRAPPPPAATKPAPPRLPDSATTVTKPDKQFSVQVAAFQRQRDADALAEVLTQRGFPVRVFVFGTKAPFRVRVGRYNTREEAAAAQQRMKAARINGMVVEAEPNEP